MLMMLIDCLVDFGAQKQESKKDEKQVMVTMGMMLSYEEMRETTQETMKKMFWEFSDVS